MKSIKNKIDKKEKLKEIIISIIINHKKQERKQSYKRKINTN